MNKIEIKQMTLSHFSERLRMHNMKDRIEENLCIKSILEGSGTIEETMERLYDAADHLEYLQSKGYELCEPLHEGHVHLKKIKILPIKDSKEPSKNSATKLD